MRLTHHCAKEKYRATKPKYFTGINKQISPYHFF